jgi:ABC-type transport system involved in cytochrome bd biosynthesis fused ATPase/permease subunit
MEQVYWALEKTGLTEFVQDQPKGLQTIIYPEGRQIPYTVARRIVLARSIIHKPKLLILKDPLDQLGKSEARRIMNFLTDAKNEWTLIVVSSNPDWTDCCSKVVQMENGRIINGI